MDADQPGDGSTARPMRVLALVPAVYDTSPGQRFRMEQWAPLLAEQGIDIIFESFEDERLHDLLYRPGHVARKAAMLSFASARRFATVAAARHCDAAYVFREAAVWGPAIVERVVRWTGLPIVFDFDDAVFERYVSPSNGYLSYLKCPGKTAAVCRLAAHVMAGNRYLSDYASRYNRHVTIVPTTIDTERYRLTGKRPVNPKPVIGWSGSYSTVQHLDTVRRALQRVCTIEPFRLRVIGTAAYQLEGVEVEPMAWRAESEVADLAAFDVGIMPLPDDRWSRGKCGLKALQYMALGIPTVCSPVGVNSEIVTHEENGLLADSEDEWVERLVRLLRSPELRARLGQAGCATVRGRYSKNSQAPVVARIFRTVARQQHGGR